MSPNLLRAVLLVLIIVGVVYFFGTESSIPNQGTLSLEQYGNEGNLVTHNSSEPEARFVGAGAGVGVGEIVNVKRNTNPQVDDDLNNLPISAPEVVDGPRKRVHFREVNVVTI